MVQVTDLCLQFASRKLFDEVNIKFNNGNCYGVIGANGAGKSTFLKVLSGEIEPTRGNVSIGKGERMSVLAQNQNASDDLTVLQAVLKGHVRLYEIMVEKEALYSKEDFTEEDGIRSADLEAEFAELNGWESEAEAEMLLNDLKVDNTLNDTLMGELDAKTKVKVLLAQALFGNPDILVLDEPTNNLDAKTVRWLENYLMDFENTIIIVSHNRHFLNKVCTHICDVDFGHIHIFMGNYDFWYETSQLLARQARDQNKKSEARAKELQDFISRFSANASKSKQATSRKKELAGLTLNDIKPSMRKYPFVDFKVEREVGREILIVENLTKKGYFENVSFMVKHDEKIAFLADKSTSISMLFEVINGTTEADGGSVTWGKTVTSTYLPENNDQFFNGCDLNLVQWLSQYSPNEQYEEFIRGWLGRMLFSGEEVKKSAKVLSGGEKVRCMLARTMLAGGNFLTLDEPTNHLDLEAITALNKGMINFKGNMLFATHDQEIMGTVANRIIELKDGKKVFDKEMSYDDYIDLD